MLLEILEFHSHALGCSKAQAVKEKVAKMLQKGRPSGSGFLQLSVSSVESVGGVVSSD